MSQYVIDIDDSVITEQINYILNTIINREMKNKYGATGNVISICVKDLIYSHKEEILEKVIDKACKELVKKGLPKLFERMEV